MYIKRYQQNDIVHVDKQLIVALDVVLVVVTEDDEEDDNHRL